MIRNSLSRLFRRVRDEEDGTASIEFIFVVPIVILMFMSSVEAGFFTTKHVLLERGLDMVMRDIRLGKVTVVDADVMRDRVCAATAILTDCMNTLKVEMTPVATDTFNMPAASATCVDRGLSSQPQTTALPGTSNELMFVRICAVQDPIFPMSGIGLHLRADAKGGYQMIASSVYVNEPR